MKKIILLGMFLFLILPIDISAQEVEYYTNHYGVKFSKKEYEFISNFYFDGYQDYMTEKDYNQFIESDIINGVINTIVSDSENLSKELIHETTMKILKVSSSCSSDCYVVTTLTWKSNPSVRSYDLIGAFLNGTSLNGNVSAKCIMIVVKQVQNTQINHLMGFHQHLNYQALQNQSILSKSLEFKKGKY